MQINFYPKRLLLTAALIVGLTGVFSIATDVRRGGLAGIAGLVAYLFFDVFFSFNPAAWWRDRR